MKILNYVMTLAVVVIVVGVCAIPIIEDVVKAGMSNVTTFSNDDEDTDQIRLTRFDTFGSYTLDYSSATGKLTVNGQVYTPTNSGLQIAFMTDTIQFRVSSSTSSLVSIATETPFNNAVTSLSLVASAGNITYSIDEGDAVQTTYYNAFIYNPEGGYINVSTPYFNNINQLAGFRYDSGDYVYWLGTAYADGAATTFNVNSTEVADTQGQVRQLENIKYTASKSLSNVIAPISVDSVIPINPALSGLVLIIPVLMIIAAVLIAVRIFASWRD